MLASTRYKKIDCDTCEDFHCFAGLEKATASEMAAFEKQRYASWQEAQAEYEAQVAAEQQGENADGQEEEDANAQEEGEDDENADGGRRAEEAAEEAEEAEEAEDQYQYTEVDSDSIAEWVENIAGCQETGATLDEWWPLYAGFMCNEDGSGVDIGLFLDEDCSIYTTTESYQNIASEDEQAIIAEATGLITYTFLNEISCSEDLTFLSIQQYSQMERNYKYNENNEYEEYGEANEYCQALFEGGALSIHDCNQDGEEDEVDENAEVEFYSYDYSGYTYVLSYADSTDMEATCSVIQNMQGEYTPVYSWKQSGQLFNYGTGPSRWDTTSIRNFFGASEKMDSVLIAAIVLSVVFALFSCFCIMWSCCGSKIKRASRKIGKGEDTKKQVLIDTKKNELIDSRTGSMLQ